MLIDRAGARDTAKDAELSTTEDAFCDLAGRQDYLTIVHSTDLGSASIMRSTVTL